MPNTLKLATVFSGIGAIESALRYLNIDHEIVFACDNGERILSQTNEEIREIIKGLSEEEKQHKIKELYTQTGKPSAYKQCGNSVVVPVIRRIAENIRKVFKED